MNQFFQIKGIKLNSPEGHEELMRRKHLREGIIYMKDSNGEYIIIDSESLQEMRFPSIYLNIKAVLDNWKNIKENYMPILSPSWSEYAKQKGLIEGKDFIRELKM